MRTAIIIATKTPSLLEGCLGALRMTTTGIDSGEVGIVIVANGTAEERQGVDGVGREFRGKCNTEAFVVIVQADAAKPAFYGNFCHQGVLAVCADPDPAGRPEELVFLNDDTYAGAGWLDNLRLDLKMALDLKHRVGLLGCRGPNVSGPQNIFDPTEIAMRQRYYRGDDFKVQQPRPVLFVFPRVVTFACMVETATYLEVGGFDLELPAHNFSDDILSCRMLKAGRHNLVSGSFVSHLGSHTINRGPTLEAAQAAYEADMKAGQEYMDRVYPEYGEWFLKELRFAGLAK